MKNTLSPKLPYLVTGGCGFVGRHLVRHLIELGHDVFIVDNLSTGLHPATWLKNAESSSDSHHLTFKVTNTKQKQSVVTVVTRDLIAALVEQLGLEADEEARWPAFAGVFHLASIVGGRVKIDGDPLHVALDLAIDAMMFRWLTTNKERVGRVLYASSSAAYPTSHQGRHGHVALREDLVAFDGQSLGQPDMTYGWSKLTGEYLGHLAAERYGLPVVSVRPFSGYGEEQETCYPVPAIAERVARGDSAIAVWGDGLQGRDFIHIDDCVRAMWEAQQTIGDGSAINIGTGRLVNFRQLAQLLLDIDGRQAEVKPQVDKPVGVMSRYADVTGLKKRLGFEAQIPLEEGLERVLIAARQRLSKKKTEAHFHSSQTHTA